MKLVQIVVAVSLYAFTLSGACAQEQGFTADLGGVSQANVPNQTYSPILFDHIKYNTFPQGAVNVVLGSDFYFVAPRTGLVRFSGQAFAVLDWNAPIPSFLDFVVKIFKNAPCSNNPTEDLISGIGTSLQSYDYAIPINGEDFANLGDVYRWCVYATGNGPSLTSYLDGNPAHTRIHVSMP